MGKFLDRRRKKRKNDAANITLYTTLTGEKAPVSTKKSPLTAKEIYAAEQQAKELQNTINGITQKVTNTFQGIANAFGAKPAPVTPRKPHSSSTVKVSRPKKPLKTYVNDSLNIAEYQIQNQNYEFIDKNGISSFRPEVISLVDFMPIYQDGANSDNRVFNDVGDFIDFQYQTLTLRRDTLIEMLSAIEEWSPDDADKTIKAMTDDFNAALTKIQQTLAFYKSYIGVIENIKKTLNIKNASTNVRYMGRDRFVFSSDFQGFFEKHLQYPKDQYESFSNSKIYLQFVNDLRSITENYSYSLLNLTDSDRAGDFDPIDIDNTFTVRDGFAFSIDTIRSPTAPKNFTQSSYFTSFLNSLPTSQDDRIKLLVNVLSKELRVSKNLADTSIQKVLVDKFGSAPGTGGDGTGNPFDNILGIAGDTIFDLPVGDNSLASLAYVGYNDSIAVLPFENKYIDFNNSNKKSFVPGSSYFIDGILNASRTTQTGIEFNTQPFLDYAALTTEYVSDATSILRKMFELEGAAPKKNQQALSQEAIYRKLLEHGLSGMSSLATSRPIIEQSFSTAVLKLANTDNDLKSLVFQFLCLAGIYSLSPKDDKTIFKQLANELQTTSNFSHVPRFRIPSVSLQDNKQLYPHLEELAGSISHRISLIASKGTGGQFNVSKSPTGAGKGIVDANSNRNNAYTMEVAKMTEVLLGMVIPKSVATTNMLKSFLDLSNLFSKTAMEKTLGYVLSDDSGRSRYNFISTSAQLLILFEIISSFADRYTFSTIAKSTSVPGEVKVTTLTVETKIIKHILNDTLNFEPIKVSTPREETTEKRLPGTTTVKVVPGSADKATIAKPPPHKTRAGVESNSGVIPPYVIGPDADPRDNPKYNGLKTSINANLDKLIQEDSIIVNAISLLDNIGKIYTDTRNSILMFFSPAGLQTFSSLFTANSVNTTDELLQVIRNPAQLKLSLSIDKFYQDRIANGIPVDNKAKTQKKVASSFFTNKIVVADYPRPEEINAMYSMLAQPEFNEPNAEERMKILSVGIPSGFVSHLSDRIVGEAINRTTFSSNRQNDIVSLNVYKRDNRYSDIVFKPKQYLFDLSLTKDDIAYKNANPRTTDSFVSRIVPNLKLQDISQVTSPKTVSANDLKKDATYASLVNTDAIDELVLNHIQSDLMATYVSFLSGMNLTEKTFTGTEVATGTASINQNFTLLIKRYIQETLGESVDPAATFNDILNDSSVDIDQRIKDIVRLATFGSITFDPSVIQGRITKPKLFDRVFHIPLTVEFFEVDEDQTNSTQNGYNALKQDSIQDKLFRFSNGRLFMRLNDEEEVVFSDFFVTIETMNDMPQREMTNQ